jgi:hypothetical protein
MSQAEMTLDYLEQQIPSLSGAAVKAAYVHALASGQTVLVSDHGGLYQAFPDGSRKMVKPMEKPLSVPVGTKVKLP